MVASGFHQALSEARVFTVDSEWEHQWMRLI